MKHLKYKLIKVFSILFIIALFTATFGVISANTNDIKKVKTLDVDTTGDEVKEKVQILANEEKKGYIVKIVHQKKDVYELKPDKNFEFLAPYTPFWKLNIIIVDINQDTVPEIITWGSMTHENPIHIFRWNGTEYEIVFSGLYTGFRFEDITGDNILELIILNRIYGTGYENIYYQWQNNKYSKIFYEFNGFRGFPVIEQFLAILPVNQPYVYNKEVLGNIFTDEWINNYNNLELLKAFNVDLLNLQIIEFLDSKIEYKTYIPIKETWKFKIKVFRIVDTSISVKVLTMTVDMKNIEDTNEVGKWRIDNIEFTE